MLFAGRSIIARGPAHWSRVPGFTQPRLFLGEAAERLASRRREPPVCPAVSERRALGGTRGLPTRAGLRQERAGGTKPAVPFGGMCFARESRKRERAKARKPGKGESVASIQALVATVTLQRPRKHERTKERNKRVVTTARSKGLGVRIFSPVSSFRPFVLSWFLCNVATDSERTHNRNRALCRAQPYCLSFSGSMRASVCA